MSQDQNKRVVELANALIAELLLEDDSRVMTATLAAVIVTMCQLAGTPVDAFLSFVKELDSASFPPSKPYLN